MSFGRFRGPRGRPFDPDEIPWGQIVRALPFVLLALAVIYTGWKGVYTVQPHEEAVVLRFGRYHSTVGPGLHFMIPLVDKAVLVETAEHSMRLPYGVDATGRIRERDLKQARRHEPLILTGDLYAAVVEWNVIWRVSDPKKFLFSIEAKEVERVITAVARSVMHRAVGDYSADEVLTGKRMEIAKSAWSEMQRTLDSYNCGIEITALQMQRVTPPERVKPAFDEVNSAMQQRDQLINEANQERNKLLPAAEAQRDKLIKEAQGYAERRKAEAEGEIAALLAKYQAYRQAPEVTRQRLYLEAIEEVLESSGPKTILDADLKSLLPLLQLGGEPAASPNSLRRKGVSR